MRDYINYTSERLKDILLEQLSRQQNKLLMQTSPTAYAMLKDLNQKLSKWQAKCYSSATAGSGFHCKKTRWLPWCMSSHGGIIKITLVSMYSEVWSWKSSIINSTYRTFLKVGKRSKQVWLQYVRNLSFYRLIINWHCHHCSLVECNQIHWLKSCLM